MAVAQHAFTGNPERDGFDLARITHGLLGQHGVNPYAIIALHASSRMDGILRRLHPQHVEAAIHLHAVWRKVVTPEAWHPVAWAAQRYFWTRNPRKAPGRYATASQRRIATAVLHTLNHLPRNEDGEVYASIRDLAHHLGLAKSTLQRTITTLERNHAITTRKPPPHSPLATRFRVLPWDRGSLEEKNKI